MMPKKSKLLDKRSKKVDLCDTKSKYGHCATKNIMLWLIMIITQKSKLRHTKSN